MSPYFLLFNSLKLLLLISSSLEYSNTIIPLSVYDEVNDVYVGLPAILNELGVKRRIKLELTKEEEAKLQHSIDVIKENIRSVKDI